MKREQATKLFYRIGEVAEAVGVQTHVLRYWESEFKTIRPQKSAKGQRVYSHKDLEKLQRVKALLHGEGYTIAGAKKKLKEFAPKTLVGKTTKAPASPSNIKQVREQLFNIRSEIRAELDRLEK